MGDHVNVAAIERLYTMEHHDRQCSCGRALMALVDETCPCPHCGRTTNPAQEISRARAKVLRGEVKL